MESESRNVYGLMIFVIQCVVGGLTIGYQMMSSYDYMRDFKGIVRFNSNSIFAHVLIFGVI